MSSDTALRVSWIDENDLYRVQMVHLMAIVAQLVRALDCGSKCRGFEPRRSPHFKKEINLCQLFTLFY